MPRQRRRKTTRQMRLDEKRCARRQPRRDIACPDVYTPMVVHRSVARRGVRDRLLLAMLGGLTTITCMVLILASSQAPFGVVWLSSVAFCSVSSVVALLLSARREETIHRLAVELVERPLLESTSCGVDGATAEPCGPRIRWPKP
jgi:hypothetical protein